MTEMRNALEDCVALLRGEISGTVQRDRILQQADALLNEPRRHWNAWAILERDETMHRITIENPATNEPIQRLVEMGWIVIPVDVAERSALCTENAND